MSSDPTSTAVSSLWSPLPSLPTIIILTISPTPNSEYCSHTICHILSPCLPIDTSIYILYKQPNPRQNGLNTLCCLITQALSSSNTIYLSYLSSHLLKSQATEATSKTQVQRLPLHNRSQTNGYQSHHQSHKTLLPDPLSHQP